MMLQSPKRNIAIVYAHFEPFSLNLVSRKLMLDSACTHLWPISQRTDKNQKDEANVEVEEDFKNSLASTLAQEIESSG